MDSLMYKNLISTFFVEKKLIHSRPERLEKCFERVKKIGDYSGLRCLDEINRKISNFEGNFMKKWRDSKCTTEERFKKENEGWIHNILQLSSSCESSKRTGGRPKKNGFDDLSERSKNRRAAELSECDLGKLLLASVQAAKETGKKDVEYVLRLIYNDGEMAKKIRDLLKAEKLLAEKPKLTKMSPLRGLTHLLDNRFSKMQYHNTRLVAKEYGANVFPSYKKVRLVKEECRPPKKFMKINDVCAALPMQPLVDHTASRLLLLQAEVIESLQVETNKIMIKLEGKWGGDGSSDQSRFNLKYENEEFTGNSDANLFATTFVPLRMTTNDGKIVWNNATPQSTRWCRPLRLQFAKETPEFTRNEIESVQEEIKKLIPFTATIAGKEITVIYELYLSMIDGKVVTVVTRTKSSQACPICEATPSLFNDLTNMEIRFKPKEGRLNYGVSVLHLWIRSFEWLLHVSYRVKVETWQMRGDDLKIVKKVRKGKLQKRFWEKMSLRVDFPSKGGSGNSNTGPVARRAFSKPELLAEVLELDVGLVKRVSTILIALSCQLPLDTDLFPRYCEETAKLYVSKYLWYPMPQSVHKILIHARDLLLANNLPLGVLAEDAAESCNKLYRHNRQFHARTGNRQQNLMDVFNRALDTSDPIISSFSLQTRLNSRHRKPLPTEVLQLLKAPDVPAAAANEVLEPLLLDENEDDDDDDYYLDDEVLDALDGLNLPVDSMYSDDDDEDD